MQSRTRRFLMVAFVATTLCVDRASIAAPTLRPQMADVARKLTSRLVVSFRRSIPATHFRALRRDEHPILAFVLPCIEPRQAAHQCESWPFQYRLPPPAL